MSPLLIFSAAPFVNNFSPPCKNFPLSFFHCIKVFRGNILLGFQISPPTFPFLFFSSFFFVILIFSFSFVFLKVGNINVGSTRKISDHKIYALRVERVQNTFENLNSFEMALKMLKAMRIHQKYIFWVFHCFLLFLIFSENLSKIWVQNWVATMLIERATIILTAWDMSLN